MCSAGNLVRSSEPARSAIVKKFERRVGKPFTLLGIVLLVVNPTSGVVLRRTRRQSCATDDDGGGVLTLLVVGHSVQFFGYIIADR